MLETMLNNLSQYLGESFTYFDFAGFTVSRVTLKDIVDILIVAYFIYKIILWIKETRAWSLFKGIILVLLISSLSFMFGFTTISWIVKTAINTGILAIIILFQPELRKALEQLGKGGFALSFLNDSTGSTIESDTVDEIIKAVYAMAKVRTGALILVERQVKLGDLEQTGIKVDAHVTAALLINIFEDKTPLHDGAVVIRNNRIAAASCILPLTASEIGKELGTRHRAAVGASEVSDTFAIVVSEETGYVSLASGGGLIRNLSPEDLRRRLIADKEKSGKDGKRFSFRKGRADE
ncbi:diadenylate cyclase CdaA [Tyzzerella sp. OttesenSCG-928-J15]|nr:diadenylate cyclase CdaA [Tyzzerella sp. OttesenSCG-928-J15]